ncbi:bifunctional diaminohydroxyphosphoribosylaminopyrimidine deaminase/5-amino-6-(5-phosphoribosylamino)uracil reductase RibD [Thalassotalea sp. LPB0316]|uniref:bifunctional diaminohydroxyphosphoribosylaminopyrimidine deaminase/5-amino-6-(5-phosphoribosylamino)uracil reductase RibD n=1 Tax=Thalassotalea sp. LPB0316 TaxID=2769490 RepID=UPI0018696A33|nr:bifunctional diaminohydroxyphosphoribosylaminopyrimidine deaminase/5-amino-6-(5-phosphoribosylamino)uracil reductase RibD [Thalassotalea sp. LPB0316]QOL27253.1 bifunctional diaminohydroxyphosphoribosylaminopyrimidine deaminase/5-amino-6-(5-phosphoribosylamino)uracil reductase RibD [Thalassotalea sp. LPB0316]
MTKDIQQSQADIDRQYMQLAIDLAKKGHFTTSPNPRVGCVIVNHGEIVGQGFHEKAGEGHAEVHALDSAGEQAIGATAYVTLEPCSHYGRTPPCALGLVNAQVKRVVVAMVDPNPQVSGNGIKLLEEAGIEVTVGVLEAQAEALNPGFIKLMRTAMPYVRCKLAASLDGKTAMASGESKWITGEQAREDVQRLRAQSCAVLTSAQSVLTDNAKMNVRWQQLGDLKNSYPEEKLRQPVRVVLDSKNRLTPDLELFSISSKIIIVGTGLENKHQWPHFVEHITVKSASGQIDLADCLQQLAKRGFNDILVECGATLAGAFIEQSLIDELILYQAPKLIGGDGKNLIEMPSVQQLAQAKQLAITSMTMVGNDIKIVAKITES